MDNGLPTHSPIGAAPQTKANLNGQIVLSVQAVTAITMVGLAALCCILYGVVAQYPFVIWDDNINLYKNPYLLTDPLAHIVHFWTSGQIGPATWVYRPVVYTVYALLAAIPSASIPTPEGGVSTLNPSIIHVSVLISHIATVWLVFFLIRKILVHTMSNHATKPVTIAAGFGATVFAVHPLQVETVAWATGLTTVLGAIFAFGSLIVFMSSTELEQESNKHRSQLYSALSTLLFVLSIFSYPVCSALPLAVIAINGLILKRAFRPILGLIALWGVADLAMVLVTHHVELRYGVLPSLPLMDRALVACNAVTFYLGKLFYPVSLAIDYGRSPQVVLGQSNLAFTIIPPLLLIFAAYLFRNRLPIVSFACAIFLLLLLPVLGFAPFRFESFSTVADRYMYMAMIGPAILIAWLLFIASQHSTRLYGAAIAVCGLISVLMAFQTSVQVVYWRDTDALFSHAVDVTPDSPIMHFNYATALAYSNNLAEAEVQYRKAVSMDPGDAGWWGSFAVLLILENKGQDAIQTARNAVKLAPGDPVELAILGDSLVSAGRVSDAVATYQQALSISPKSVDLHLKLAESEVKLGQKAQALNEARQVLSLDPTSAKAKQKVWSLENETPGGLSPQ